MNPKEIIPEIKLQENMICGQLMGKVVNMFLKY
jgi:hypothetical protein